MVQMGRLALGDKSYITNEYYHACNVEEVLALNVLS